MATMRWCFIADGNHWYLIPADQSNDFDRLADNIEGREKEFSDKFDEFRIKRSLQSFTFTNPQNKDY